MIKVIIFDFFDVIMSDPYNAWLKNHGYIRQAGFLEASQKLDSGRINSTQFFQLLSSLSDQDAADIEQEFGEAAKINHDMLKIVESLRSHYKIGLLSNSPSSQIRGILEDSDLEKYFDDIVVSSEVRHIKPSKEIFKISLKRLRANASDTLFIDDNKSHTEGAEKVGIKSIVFESVPQLRSEFNKLNIILE